MRGQIIVAATTFVRRGGIYGLARINTPLGEIFTIEKSGKLIPFFADGRFLTNQRGIVTSIARLGDDKVTQQTVQICNSN